MRRKALPLLFAAVVVLVGAGAVGIVRPAAADKGGCPNEAASTGADHANAKSAHGSAKQGLRGCATVVPTPTPTPTPANEADVRVEGVSVTAPPSASVGEDFSVTVGVSLRNDGPAGEVVVDTTVELTAPFGCSFLSPNPVTVEDTLLKKGQGVFVGIGWSVICSQPGSFTFTANATVDIDPAETAVDPDLGNNSLSGSGTTDVHS